MARADEGHTLSLLLRPPFVEDAAELGAVHVAAWKAAYRGLMGDDYLAGLRAEDRAAWWSDVLTRPPRDRQVQRVAEVDGRVRGFVVAGPAGGDDSSVQGEVFALNVHPDAWGSGLGSALLHVAETELALAGFASAVLWVVSGNARARRFYEGAGWQQDSAERVEEVHGVTIEEVRYRRALPRSR